MSRARPRRKAPAVLVSKERMYEVIRRPLVTEKSTLGSEHNQVAFEVAIDATKPEIKAALEVLFKVKVKAINTLRQAGKVKRFRGRLGRAQGGFSAAQTVNLQSEDAREGSLAFFAKRDPIFRGR